MSLLSTFALAAPPAIGAEDIRDIRSPLLVGEWWRWPLAVGVVAVVALGVVLVVRYVRRRRSRPATAHEQALAALRLAETLAHEGRSREWAEVIAETLRAALSTRLGAEVSPLTTSELAQTWSALPPVFAPRILELLGTCDLSRFARASLDDQALLAQTTIARDLVEQLFQPISAPPQPATVAP